MARILTVGVVLLLVACQQDAVTLRLSGETMGTTYNITIVDKGASLNEDDVQAAVDATLAEVNAAMSNWDPNSEVSQFNAHKSTEPFEVSAALAKVMAAANDVHENSDGQFDVTLGPLIELWGFGARDADSPVPSDDAISEALASVGQTATLELVGEEPRTLTKTKFPETTVYLAAIAKGYGVDEVAATLEGLGVTDYMVEIGGDLVTSGENPDGRAWRVGVERPDAQTRPLDDQSKKVERLVDLTDLGLATSGDYRNYFEQDGVRYSHIIDAQTGRPITHNTASVTVVADNAMLADAWATALLAVGQERGLALSEEHELAAMFITRDMSEEEMQFVTTANAKFEALQVDQ
ncbi:MAG: FAD:protein FMN transferase [Pseudomonadota bacterium]